MPNDLDIGLQENTVTTPVSPSHDPIYAKCLVCNDYGATCRGFTISSLKDSRQVRAYHKAMLKAKNIQVKAIQKQVANVISESTISEYFGSKDKDYLWNTVIAVNDALLTLSGHREGMPSIDHSCPAASSEHRSLLAAAELNLAAVNVTLANTQAERDSLRRQLEDSDGTHLAQLAQIQASSADDVKWFKQETRFWRRLSFALLGVVVLFIIVLVAYLVLDIMHGDSGFIRY